MNLTNHTSEFNAIDLNSLYKQGKPTCSVVIDSFLPSQLALDLHNECTSLDQSLWTTFTRNSSHMEECKQLAYMPVGKQFVEHMHSSEVIRWLETLTGITGLIPDPHLTGAGYSRSYQGDTLKIHNDFNWNNELQLHRAISIILYITPDWNPAWGGALDFYDSTKEKIVTSVNCIFNRLLVWQYHSRNFHGHTTPLSCPKGVTRNTMRIYYYTSNSTHNVEDLPHRSQYWYDHVTNTSYDKREHK